MGYNYNLERRRWTTEQLNDEKDTWMCRKRLREWKAGAIVRKIEWDSATPSIHMLPGETNVL